MYGLVAVRVGVDIEISQRRGDIVRRQVAGVSQFRAVAVVHEAIMDRIDQVAILGGGDILNGLIPVYGSLRKSLVSGKRGGQAAAESVKKVIIIDQDYVRDRSVGLESINDGFQVGLIGIQFRL